MKVRRVRLFATPWTAAYQALPSMGFSRQEYWSGVPLPSPSEHVQIRSDQISHSVMSDSYRLHGLQPTRLFRPWDFPGKSTGVGCHCLLRETDGASQIPLSLNWSRQKHLISPHLLQPKRIQMYMTLLFEFLDTDHTQSTLISY